MTEELKLNWTVQEYLGQDVYKKNMPDVLITNKDDLKEGDEIIAGGWLFTIVKDQYGVLYGSNQSRLQAILEFNGDDRHAWVAIAFVNTKALEKLMMNKENA